MIGFTDISVHITEISEVSSVNIIALMMFHSMHHK